MARNVWFQLVDAATGGAYADTHTTLVSSDGVSIIDDLRNVIREKFREDVLDGIAAAQLRIYASRAEYDKKNGRPLEEDSSLGSLGEAKRNALIVVVKEPTARRKSLRVTAQDSYPPFLKKAIEIANVMLTHTHNNFEAELGANKTTRENLREVKVKFRRSDTPAAYGWTDRSKTAKVIFVNKVLRDRVKEIDQAENPHEYQCIVFVVAATIFHECAHLTLRWRGILDSPSKFGPDVGDYMEATLFKGICGVKVQRSTQVAPRKSKRSRWTKEMPILDVVIELKGLSVVRADHLNKFFTEGNLRDKALFPLDREAYKKTEGAVAFRGADHLDGGRKRRRTSPEDPNVMIPPLAVSPRINSQAGNYPCNGSRVPSWPVEESLDNTVRSGLAQGCAALLAATSSSSKHQYMYAFDSDSIDTLFREKLRPQANLPVQDDPNSTI